MTLFSRILDENHKYDLSKHSDDYAIREQFRHHVRRFPIGPKPRGGVQKHTNTKGPADDGPEHPHRMFLHAYLDHQFTGSWVSHGNSKAARIPGKSFAKRLSIKHGLTPTRGKQIINDFHDHIGKTDPNFRGNNTESVDLLGGPMSLYDRLFESDAKEQFK